MELHDAISWRISTENKRWLCSNYWKHTSQTQNECGHWPLQILKSLWQLPPSTTLIPRCAPHAFERERMPQTICIKKGVRSRDWRTTKYEIKTKTNLNMTRWSRRPNLMWLAVNLCVCRRKLPCLRHQWCSTRCGAPLQTELAPASKVRT